MKKGLFPACLLLWTIFLAQTCWASMSLDLSLDRTDCALDETVRLVVRAKGVQRPADTPKIRGLEPFRVQQGGTSSRVEIINGQVNSAVEYTYILAPRKTGTFQVGPAEIIVDGKTLVSQVVELKVHDAPSTKAPSSEPLFLTGTLSKDRVYLEEQITYVLKLYRRIQVTDVSLELPELEHATFRQLGQPLEYQASHEGDPYQVLEIRYALFLTKEGEYEIPPVKMHLTAIAPQDRRQKTPFDDRFFRSPFFSFGAGRKVTVKTDALKFTVSPLPLAGRPADFSGLVGSFRMETTLEPPSIAAGDSSTLTVVISGRGNVHRIPDLKGPEPVSVKVYADQPTLSTETGNQGISGAKTMKWALVPERGGRFEIRPLTLSYFDPASHRYQLLKSEPLALTVVAGQEAKKPAAEDSKKSGPLDAASKKAVQDLARDILPIHSSLKGLTPDHGPGPGGILFWAALLGPPCGFVFVFLGQRLSRRSPDALAAVRAKKAARRMVKKCSVAINADALASALRDYVNDRFGLSLGALTSRELETELSARGVRQETLERVTSLLNALEDVIYSGRGGESCRLAEGIPELIRRIEREMR